MKFKLSYLSVIFGTILMIIQGLTSSYGSVKIGAILDLDSRIGLEQKTAIQIAVENFSNSNFKISIQFMPYNQSLLQIATEVEALVKENKVEVIILGVDNWQATSLVAQIGAIAQVPILSLAATSPITSPFSSLQWPFLVQLSHNATQQVQNVASIIKTYCWRKVILVYEDDIGTNGRNSDTISLLTEALQSIGSQIEHRLVFPPFVSMSNTRGVVKEELKKFIKKKCYSRVFVVLGMSRRFASPFFEEVNTMGLMKNDSVWITIGSIMDLLPSFDYSILSNMNGAIGIMTTFDNSTVDYQVFEAKFGINFLQDYGKDNYHGPSYQALISYDAINIIIKAKISFSNTSDKAPRSYRFLKEILLSNFTGLSGQVSFNQEDHSLAGNASMKLVNIASARYHDVLDFPNNDTEDENNVKILANEVIWPGNIKGVLSPKGWVMPTYSNPMRIGVPIVHTYKNIIDYKGRPLKNNECFPSRKALDSIYNKDFSGYCIGIFREVVKLLEYELPYELIPFNCSFDDLVNSVNNKTFDAAVGDMTILANRSDIVDFSMPFQESGLSIILPAQQSYKSHGPWIFLQPFTSNMWIVTFFVFICTMIIIWVLEHQQNSEFRGGPLMHQLSTTAWFGFNSLYFAQRERISSKLARVVVILWLFIVLILSQSYTANLTSMITNARLNQTTIDIEMLQRTNAKVGYDNTSFINKFLEDLLRFNPDNTIGIDGKFEDFHQQFNVGKISAACLEYFYAKLFLSKYCNKYIMTQPIHRFGGLGFVFPKGSPVTHDVSKAMLTLIENGKLKQLEQEFLNIRSECTSTTDDTYNNNDDEHHQSSLSLDSFRILYYVSGATTTICFLASLVPLYINYRNN